MKSPDPRTLSRDAFTLTELLVSLVVIAILATLATSAVIKVMETSHTAKCMGNLKSIGIAMRGYMADNNGYGPPHYTTPFHSPDWTKSRWNWMTWLSPYLVHDASEAMPSVFDCPADPNVKTWPKPRPYFPASPSESAPALGSYGYNYVDLSTSISWVNGADPPKSPPRAHTIQNSARLILVADGRATGVDTICVNHLSEAARPALRHNRHFNAVFLDGHVGNMPKEAASDLQYWKPE